MLKQISKKIIALNGNALFLHRYFSGFSEIKARNSRSNQGFCGFCRQKSRKKFKEKPFLKREKSDFKFQFRNVKVFAVQKGELILDAGEINFNRNNKQKTTKWGDRIPEKKHKITQQSGAFSTSDFVAYVKGLFCEPKNDCMKKSTTLLKLLTVWLATSACSQLFAQQAGLKTNLLYDATTTIHVGYETALSRNTTLDVWVNYNPWVLGRKWVGLYDMDSKANPTASNREIQLKHLAVQPEMRWWLCEKFNGHFFGVHIHGALYTAGGLKLPFDWGRYGTTDSKGNFEYLGKIIDGTSNPKALHVVGNAELEVHGVGYKTGNVLYPGLGKTPGTQEEPNDVFWGNADRDGIYINTFDGWLAGIGASYGYHWVIGRRLSLEFTIGLGYAYLDFDKSRCAGCKKKIGEEKAHYFGPTRAGFSLVYMIK